MKGIVKSGHLSNCTTLTIFLGQTKRICSDILFRTQSISHFRRSKTLILTGNPREGTTSHVPTKTPTVTHGSRRL